MRVRRFNRINLMMEEVDVYDDQSWHLWLSTKGGAGPIPYKWDMARNCWTDDFDLVEISQRQMTDEYNYVGPCSSPGALTST